MSSDSDTHRLNKFLALHTGISRREADELIEKGRVTVNGQIAALGSQVAATDVVEVDGKSVSHDTEFVYVALHKPVGYVCSRRGYGNVPTAYDLLPSKYGALKTVGRLDKDSSGLILLTNDGDFAQSMTHPSYAKVKKYEVTLDKALEPLHQQMISDHGIDLDDGNSRFLIEKKNDYDTAVQHERSERALGDKADGTNSFRTEAERRAPTYVITMSEGRNRQIRRTFAALGYNVKKLHRTDFGRFTLGGLKSGEFKEVK